MAQDTLESAWQAQDRFEPGTNLKAWLFTILRNTVHSHSRRSWRNAHWDPEKGENIAGPANQQEWTVELSETVRAIYKLPKAQRDTLILVGIGGASYEDAAKKFGTAVGTVRSRIARGRDALLSILADDEVDSRDSYTRRAIPSFAPACLQP
jgi:RNA polymerase sigma-70 factor (ECF subfamily)